MLLLAVTAILATAALVFSTEQFVTGASRVATGLKVSPVLVGAVILGCGVGLPELALAFQRDHGNPWRELLGLDGAGGNFQLLILVTVLVVILSIPTIFPNLMRRHSPVILAATIMFAALLRGSLDIVEGTAMLAGFIIGIAWVVISSRSENDDPFAPLIEDDYEDHGAYIEGPVMTQAQAGFTRCLLGLLGTAIASQFLARSVQSMLEHYGFNQTVAGVVFIVLGSILPHVVVAVQAVAQHHEGLAVGNLIGSNLFQSLAIGGLVAIIAPYEEGGHVGFASFGIIAATAVLTWMLLRTDTDLSRRQGFGLLGAYVALVALAVP